MISQKQKFSLPAKATYLNCAYMSPLLKAAEKAGIEGIRRKRNPAAIASDAFFSEAQKLRQEFARVIGAKSERIAIIPSASYGLANAAMNCNVEQSHNIVVAGGQFPSNVYPWMTLCAEYGAQLRQVNPPDSLERRGKNWNERILEAIDSKTRVVAIANVHWADGTKFDLVALRRRTRDVGALLVVDGTQSVGALPFDVNVIQPDALICAGYKWLLGPYAIGLAYYGPHFDQGKPFEQNWANRKNSEDFSALVRYENEYQPGAQRFDVGERSNFALMPIMTVALKQINAWKPANIQRYCENISARPLELLRSGGFWIEDEDSRGHHLFGIRLPKSANLEKIKRRLIKEKISVSFRGDVIRVSPNVYNTQGDMMKLAKALMA